MTCARCQGNGEIVTDWDRYLNPRDGDVGDEAVAPCPDCDGDLPHCQHPQRDPGECFAGICFCDAAYRRAKLLQTTNGDR